MTALPDPTPAQREAAHACVLAELDRVSSYGAPEFSEAAIVSAIDRLLEIENAMLPDLRARYRPPLNPWEDIAF